MSHPCCECNITSEDVIWIFTSVGSINIKCIYFYKYAVNTVKYRVGWSFCSIFSVRIKLENSCEALYLQQWHILYVCVCFPAWLWECLLWSVLPRLPHPALVSSACLCLHSSSPGCDVCGLPEPRRQEKAPPGVYFVVFIYFDGWVTLYDRWDVVRKDSQLGEKISRL